jgi:hypothetical protein
MKYIVLSILLIPYFSFAQLKESYFQYHIELMAMDTSLRTKQAIQMLRGSQMELYFAHNKSRMDFKMGSLKMTSVIVDKDNNVALYLSEDQQNGKIAQVRKADMMQSKQKDPNAKVQYTGKSKVIMGYNCKELVLTSLGTKATYWVTNDIKLEQGSEIINANLPAFPVAFSKEQEGVRMSFQLSNMRDHFDYPLESIFFTIPPKEFKLIK